MLDLPVHLGVCNGSPINPDVVFITESKELFAGELCAVVCDDRVQDPKAMDDVEEEQHGLLGLDCRYRPSLYPLCKLVYGDKQVGVAPRRSFERIDQIEPQTTNGHVMGIIWNAWAGRWVYRA